MSERENYGNDRIRELEKQLELERQKCRMISSMVNCGLWEYNIRTGTLVQSRKPEGTKAAEEMEIPDFRNTVQAWNLVLEEDLPVFEELCDSLEHGEEAFSYELRVNAEAGSCIWLRYEGYTVYGDDGKPVKVIGRTLNINDDKKSEEVVIRESDLDPVTGLFTQKCIQERLENYAAKAGEQERIAVFALDVDDFTGIVDTWGHAYGEYVLEKLAKGLKSIFMDMDDIAHTEADGFVILRRSVKNPAEIYAAARAIARMTERIELKRDSKISISVGVSIFPLDGKDYQTLYRKALMALQETRKNPNTICTLYEDSMGMHQKYQGKAADAPKNEAVKTPQEKQNIQYGPVEKYIVSKIFDMLASNEENAGAVEHIFAEIGKYYHYNRIYALVYDERKKNVSVRYYWEQGENPFASVFETVMQANWSAIRERFANDQIFISTNTAQLGIRMPQQMKAYYPDASVFQYVIMDNEDTFSCITMEKAVNQNWIKEEQDMLVSISKLLGIYVERVRTRELLADEVYYTHAIIENQQVTNYAIVPDTYELVYVGDYTGRQYPMAHSGEHCYSSIMGRTTPCTNCPVKGLSDKKTRNTTESYFEKQKRFISTTASYVDSKDKTQCLVCWSDVTDFVERVRSKDVLTGQLTMEKFEDETMRCVAERPKEARCFVSFTFPDFNDLNDVWGYQTGNEILKVFSNSMTAYLKEGELLARVSGANFAMMIAYEDKERTEARVEMMMQSAHNAVLRLYPDLRLNVWCGVNRFQKQDTVATAMERANLARKSIGSMQDPATIAVAFYTDDLRKVNSFQDFVENSMRDALSNREFKVFLQPKRDRETGAIVGAQAMVRWLTSEGQVIEPCSFRPIFEQDGFIVELDYYVHKETFRLIREWLDQGIQPPIISIESSWQYIFSNDFLSRTKYLLQRYNVPAETIELIIPDGTCDNNFNTIMNVLQELHSMGFMVDIDTYLSRYTRLTVNKDLPADKKKYNADYFRKLFGGDGRLTGNPMLPEDFTYLISNL